MSPPEISTGSSPYINLDFTYTVIFEFAVNSFASKYE